MNGFSLLIALAAVGIDVGWEAGNDGQLRYTIQIEQSMFDPLREGQAIVSPVEQKDRGLVNFQIKAGLEAGQRSLAPPATETMVEYGWRPSENGGVDFLIQVSPERLETLAKGTPVYGQVPAEVSDVRRFYIFAGVGKLPRQNPPAEKTPEPPPFIGDRGQATAASGERESSISAPRGTSQFSDRQTTPQNRYAAGDTTADSRFDSTNTNSRWNEPWRQEPGSASANWSDPENRQLQNYDPNARFAARDGYGDRYSSPPAGGGYGDRYQADPYQGERYQGERYQNDRYQMASRENAGQAYRPTTPAEAPFPTAPPTQPVAATQPPAQPPAWPNTAVAAPVTAPATAATPVAATPAVVTAEEEVRPWTPLILTTLALFASLGANAYLGWLAWSFFWRFRDAASDVVRARQTSSRQAA